MELIEEGIRESVVSISDEENGRPVSAIGDYGFYNQQQIEKIILPQSLEKIGSHAFFNCKNLKELTLFGNHLTIGDGAFKNCRSLEKIIISGGDGQEACMKDILSELSKELLFFFPEYEKDAKVALFFPAYLYDYEENTQARIINQLTYGMGVHYRECVSRTAIDFHRYDDLFSMALVQEKQEALVKIALSRLPYPYRLSREAENRYRNYLAAELNGIVEGFIREENLNQVILLSQLGFFGEENIGDMLMLAQKQEKVEFTSFFLNYKNTCLKKRKRSFEL